VKAPILSPSFKYDDENNAASHGNPELFRKRMQDRLREARQPAVTTLTEAKHDGRKATA
jgi:hypothetical protein